VDALDEVGATKLVEDGLVEYTGKAVDHSPVVVRDRLAQGRIFEQCRFVNAFLEANDLAAGVDLAGVLGDLEQLARRS